MTACAASRQGDGYRGIDAPRNRGDLTFVKILLTSLRKLVIGIIGGTVLLIGIALIVLPGPAFIVIPIGLAILATEFAWARSALNRAKAMVGRGKASS